MVRFKPLLILNEARGLTSHRSVADLANEFEPGDLVVVNDAATLPASLKGVHQASGAAIELRLAACLDSQMAEASRWQAVLFGRGDWTVTTEKREAPPQVRVGDRLYFSNDLVAEVRSERFGSKLLEIAFLGSAETIWPKLYGAGRLIQYSYRKRELDLWDNQTLFAGAPVSVEPPSAALPLRWSTILGLRKRGVETVALTHAAGISSTGSADVDRLLPLPERFTITEETAHAVNQALSSGRRVFAVGTSVVRALESAFDSGTGQVRAGNAITSLKITRDYKRRVVSGLLTGLHEAQSSHLSLLSSFIDPSVLDRGYEEARARGYQWHEDGDLCLIYSSI